MIRFEIGSIIFEKLSVEVRYGSVRFSKQNNFKTYVKECNYCVFNIFVKVEFDDLIILDGKTLSFL